MHYFSFPKSRVCAPFWDVFPVRDAGKWNMMDGKSPAWYFPYPFPSISRILSGDEPCVCLVISDAWVPLSSNQPLNHVRLSASPRPTCQAPLSISNSQSLLRIMSIKSMMPSNHLILCQPLLLPSVFPSIRVFSSESVFCIMWPKYWSFSFNIIPSNVYSGLISFRIECFDLLAVQEILSGVFSNTPVQKYQFFSRQLSLQSNSHIHAWLLEKS